MCSTAPRSLQQSSSSWQVTRCEFVFVVDLPRDTVTSKPTAIENWLGFFGLFRLIKFDKYFNYYISVVFFSLLFLVNYNSTDFAKLRAFFSNLGFKIIVNVLHSDHITKDQDLWLSEKEKIRRRW